ncbi:MAG: hypothetical protein JXA42_02895 [Anaerolineales bacterium]|nr:hypothetical protein [Anaerolineales bacterium]
MLDIIKPGGGFSREIYDICAAGGYVIEESFVNTKEYPDWGKGRLAQMVGEAQQ